MRRWQIVLCLLGSFASAAQAGGAEEGLSVARRKAPAALWLKLDPYTWIHPDRADVLRFEITRNGKECAACLMHVSKYPDIRKLRDLPKTVLGPVSFLFANAALTTDEKTLLIDQELPDGRAPNGRPMTWYRGNEPDALIYRRRAIVAVPLPAGEPAIISGAGAYNCWRYNPATDCVCATAAENGKAGVVRFDLGRKQRTELGFHEYEAPQFIHQNKMFPGGGTNESE